MEKKVLIAVLNLLLLSVLAIAQTTDLQQINLNEVEINAMKKSELTETGKIVTIIDKMEIENSAANSLEDLIKSVLGIDIRKRGTNGVQADISIRGGSFDQVLVLLNGVNISDPQTGHYNLDVPIELNDITQIEILHGSAARMYGANAFSGVINIITGKNNNNFISSETAIGSFGFQSQNISANYKTEKLKLFGSGTAKQSDGYIKNTDFNTKNLFVQSQINITPFKIINVQLGLQNKAFGANNFYTTAYPNQFEHTKTLFSTIEWIQKSKNWFFNYQLFWRQHHDRFELFRSNENALSWYQGHNYHQSDISGGKFSVNKTWDFGKTTFGGELRNEHIYSNVLGKPMENKKSVPFEKNQFFNKSDNRLLSTFFLNQNYNTKHWFFSGGISSTNSKAFGANFLGGGEIIYSPTQISQLFVGINSAVRLPTFTDLYYTSATQKSNPNLRPEHSVTFDAGIKITPSQQEISIAAFARNGKDIIDWIRKPDETIWESSNLTAINAFGFESKYEYKFETPYLKSVSLGYSFLQLDKKADNFDSKYALDYLKNKVIVQTDFQLCKHLFLQNNIGFFDRNGTYLNVETQNLQSYSPYWLVDAKITWRKENFKIYADLQNILNQSYVDFGGISLPGINLNFGLQISLKE